MADSAVRSGIYKKQNEVASFLLKLGTASQADSGKPKARTIARLRAFLDAKEKRNAGGDGIKPIEPVQIKILKPTRYSLCLRLCPFCRKSHGKIQTAGRN